MIESYEGLREREAVVGSFCALLELVRLQVIKISQDGPGDDISIAITPEHEQDIDAVVEETLGGEEHALAANPTDAAGPPGDPSA